MLVIWETVNPYCPNLAQHILIRIYTYDGNFVMITLKLYKLKNSRLSFLGGGAKVDLDFRISDLIKNPVVNFGEVRRAQIAKSTFLTSSKGSLGSFQIF